MTTGNILGMHKELSFDPVNAQVLRLTVTEAMGVPTLWEFQLFPAKE